MVNNVQLTEMVNNETQLEKQISTCQSNIDEQPVKIELPSFTLNVITDNQQRCDNTSDDTNIIKSLTLSQNSNEISQHLIMTTKQYTLFKVQLTQHVQLMTQIFMLSLLVKKYYKHCITIEKLLVSILIYP